MREKIKFVMMFLVLSCTLVYAQSVTPIAEDGKTWWYSDTFYVAPYPSMETENIRFGFTVHSTCEINGEEWFNVMYVDGEGRDIVDFPVAYLRETDEGCFVLPGVDTQERLDALLAVPGHYGWIGQNYLLPYTDRWREDMEEMKNMDKNDWPSLLYPATIAVGDELSYSWMYTGYESEEERKGTCFRITGVLPYNGSLKEYIGECRWWGHTFLYTSLVERVGITYTEDYGLFLFPFIWHDIPTHNSMRPSYFPILDTVCDVHGNIIYRADHNGGLPEELKRREWNYTALEKDVYTAENTITRHDGYYFGGTEVIEGIEYAVFRTSGGDPYAYLRQEGTKVYLRNDKGAVHIHEQDPDTPVKEEYMLYDYSLQPGERFRSVAFWEDDLSEDCRGTAIEAEITKVYTKTICGKTYRYQDYSMIDATGTIESGAMCSNTVIEGIGPQRGMFCAPQLGWWVTATTDEFWFLTSVTTKDGEMLWDDTSGIESVEADASQSTDGTIYDLYGRRVVTPLPGTIYIRDGRKYVAR